MECKTIPKYEYFSDYLRSDTTICAILVPKNIDENYSKNVK